MRGGFFWAGGYTKYNPLLYISSCDSVDVHMKNVSYKNNAWWWASKEVVFGLTTIF
jgi:hypothetical protein